MKKYLMTGIAALTLGGMITSCSHDMDQYTGGNVTENIQKDYETKFVSRFGEPASTQDWGFGSSSVAGVRGGTRSNPGESYPATHEYKDADGNVIAGANMNHNEWADPSTKFGGWVVPDALTEGQKLRVQKYFQANPNLRYDDPHYRHFFVQQVYTGGTSAPETGNKESTKAADGTVHAGSKMNQLTVGEACSHINDFNAGTCSKSNVLDNGTTVNNGTYHEDQITLMVNVYDTSCFGYHETGGSNVKGVINHNDKMALVSAAVIDAWAAANGNPGEAVVDKWNRSFMGFDYELLPEEDIIPENPTYAMLSAVPNINNIKYAWDGTTLYTIKEKAESGASGNDLTARLEGIWGWNGKQVTKDGDNYVWEAGQWSGFSIDNINANWSTFEKLVVEFGEATPMAGKFCIKNNYQDQPAVEFTANATSVELPINSSYTSVNNVWVQTYDGGNLTINKIYLVGEAPVENNLYYSTDYLLGEDNKVMFYSSSNTNQYGGTIINLSEDDMKTTQDGKTCLNLVKFKELADGGYHPISTDLKKWVKWESASDGYYSDWIVTLTEAKRIGEDGDDEIESVRVIAEDLTVNDVNADFDFNDVVFDVIWNKTQKKVSVNLLAAGGELTLYVGGTADGVDGVRNVNSLFQLANPDKTIGEKDMLNTIRPKDDPSKDYKHEYKPYLYELDNSWWSGSNINEIAKSIYVRVMKGGNLVTLTAEPGRAAAKIAVGTDYDWCDEREDIDTKYDGNFSEYVGDETGTILWNEWYK